MKYVNYVLLWKMDVLCAHYLLSWVLQAREQLSFQVNHIEHRFIHRPSLGYWNWFSRYT